MSEYQSSSVFREDDEDHVSSLDEGENRLVDDIAVDLSRNDNYVPVTDEAMREINLDQNQIKKVDKIFCACYEQQWNVLEQFLCNDNISLDEKKNILHFQQNYCLKAAFGNGAPLTTIKAMAKIEGKQVVISGTKDQPPWLHVALMLEETPLEVIKYYVNLGGKTSLKIKSDFYCGGTALHIAVGGFGKQEIIKLLLKEGGVELLDITDGGGFRVLDYCDAPERETIVNCLVSIEKSSKITLQELVACLEHKKRFSSSAITPREVENWIHQGRVDLFRDYLNSTEVSEREKTRYLNYRNTLNGKTLLHTYSSYCHPVDIVTRIVTLMGEDCLLFSPDGDGNTCLHLACDSDIDMDKQNEFVKFLIDNTGADFIHEVNHQSETALHKLISYQREVTNFELIQMMIRIGGEDLLIAQDFTQIPSFIIFLCMR